MERVKAEASAVAELVREHVKPVELTANAGTDGSVPYLVLPKGLEVHSLKSILAEYKLRPDRKKGTSHHDTLVSFVEHVNRFKDPDVEGQSALFACANASDPELICVYNYNEPGRNGPRFRDFRAVYRCPLSEEWKVWVAVAGSLMEQSEFAEFIEEHVHDVIDPKDAGKNATELANILATNLATPAQLMALSRGLTVHVGKRVQNATNLSTGEAQIAFAEEHSDQAGQPLKVPAAFAIAIPVFQSGRLWQLPVRLRYRVQGGRISWILQPHRVVETFQAVFEEACAEAREKTELPLFFGRPE